MTKPFLVEKAPVVSASLVVMGAVIMLLGVIGTITASLDLGGLEYPAIVAGSLLLLSGAYWIGTYASRVRKFRSLLEEKKKAVFVRNMDDVEYLAWKLPVRFEDELSDKKREMGVK